MSKMKEEPKSSKARKDRTNAVALTQLQGIDEAEEILTNVIYTGIKHADIEYREELCYDIEGLIDYYEPCVLRDFRHLFSVLHYAESSNIYPESIAYLNYLLVMVSQAKTYLEHRVSNADPDITSLVEAHLGHLWRNEDLIRYKMYAEDAEILQLSFNCVKDVERVSFYDKGYWFDLKSRKIHYTYRIRPITAEKFIKSHDTEFDVLQPEKLFIYPGRTNHRVRWTTTEKRKLTPKDMAVVFESAETDYAEIIRRTKEGFRDPLAEFPVLLIKLHKTFINGNFLVLEDEHGGMLPVVDIPEDNAPTLGLLRAVLPAQPVECALLVEVNNDFQSSLFSVKALSVITPERIIRLLY